MIILDIETTGLSPTKHCMVSLGAVDYDTGDEFYGECCVYEGRKIDAFALGVNGFTREQCIGGPLSPRPHALYMDFLRWAVIDTKREPLLAGQQVGAFDIPFLKAIAEDRDQGIVPTWPFGYRSVDLHSVAFAKLGKSLSLDGILQAVGLQPEPKPHNALTGAKLERDAFKLLLT